MYRKKSIFFYMDSNLLITICSAVSTLYLPLFIICLECKTENAVCALIDVRESD